MRRPKPETIAPLPSYTRTGLSRSEVEILDSLHAAIVFQRLSPGMRLPEEELAAIYGASRTKIRRVLFGLAHTGMITLLPSKGARVAKPTPDDAQAVFAARRMIEVVQLTVPNLRLSKDAFARLRAIIAYETAASQNRDRGAMAQLSGLFHTELAKACGNPVVAEIVQDLVVRSALILALFQPAGVVGLNHKAHAGIVAALERGDGSAAAAMTGYLDALVATLVLAPEDSKVSNLAELLKPSPKPS